MLVGFCCTCAALAAKGMSSSELLLMLALLALGNAHFSPYKAYSGLAAATERWEADSR